QLREEVEVVGQLERVPARRPRRRHRAAIPLVDEDEVEVAVVAHLLAAELAESEEDEAARLPGPGAGIAGRRHAETREEHRILERRDLLEDRLGEIAELVGRLEDRVLAEDVADADAEEFLVLEAVQNRIGIVRVLAELGEFLLHLLGGPRSIED